LIMSNTIRTRVLSVVLSILATSGLAAAQSRPLAIEDYYRVKTVGAPQISPDGNWVAFTVAIRIEATNGDSVDAWLGSTDGATPARRVSRPGTNASGLQWSDDGRLNFSAGGRRWAINPAMPDSIIEGTAAVQQGGRGGRGGAGGGGGRSMASRDGKWVVSLRDVPVSQRDHAYASDFEKRSEERFKGVEFDWLNFQRDGAPFPVPNRVDPLVSPAQEVWISGDASGAGATQITRLGLRPSGIEWSPDGSTLLFTADSGYRNERLYEKGDIYTASRDGVVRRLTNDREMNYTNARYSPDGKWILYTRQLSTNAVIAKRLDHGGATDLAVIPAGGGLEKNLTADWDYLPTGATWSPDSKYVYFSGGIGGTTHLFRVSPTSARVEQVTKGERRIGAISFDRTYSRMAYTVGLTDSLTDVYVSSIDGSNEHRISHANDSFAAEIALSKSERLHYPSKDGTTIEAWLLYPHHYRRDAGPYPLVVANHGGPHSANEYGFDFKNQLLAANGYFVLEVNFRSSTGYGEKFLWGTWGAWGDRDGEDVMAGVDHAIAHYPIARARVATMGHSYGGFMTNWLITQYPDRFAAAIPGAGIVNWVSDYGNADIARTKETEFYGTPWDSMARKIMIRQSPLTYANRVKAPTLFINGEIDQRVPYSEAEQFFVALKKNGVPAKVIQYQGMPHSISGSWNNVHRMLNELHWLDTYLKPPKP
jgi:dipeptidyl aminopeptidase/acylaminoacyl peptidase